MDCISFLWVKDGFQSLLDRIYTQKSTAGVASTAEEVIRLLAYLDHYNLADMYPRLIDDETSLWNELSTSGLYDTYQQKNDEQRRSIIRAWREVWDTHDGIKKAADTYKVFPGDLQRSNRVNDLNVYNDDQHVLEDAFWAEVNKIMKDNEYKCSRSDAMVQARDTHLRGDFTML